MKLARVFFFFFSFFFLSLSLSLLFSVLRFCVFFPPSLPERKPERVRFKWLVTALYATQLAIDWFLLSQKRAGIGEFGARDRIFTLTMTALFGRSDVSVFICA